MRKALLFLMIVVCPLSVLAQSQVRTEASNNKSTFFNTAAGTDTLVVYSIQADSVRYIERIIFNAPVASDTTIICSDSDTLVSIIQTSDLKPYVIEVGAVSRGDYTYVIRKKASKLTVVWRQRY